jgi:hypothetical protein
LDNVFLIPKSLHEFHKDFRHIFWVCPFPTKECQYKKQKRKIRRDMAGRRGRGRGRERERERERKREGEERGKRELRTLSYYSPGFVGASENAYPKEC